MRQRSRITFLAEGDANTRFFHLQACHRSLKNYIPKLQTSEAVLVTDEEMATAVFDHFDAVMGTLGYQSTHILLEELHLPSIHDALLDQSFSEEEVWQAILDMPMDKAPGPDGFCGSPA